MHNWRLEKQREKYEEAGIKFDKTPEDEKRYVTFMLQRPHQTRATGVSEWYTPPEIIGAARQVMGSIMVDPASCEEANKIIKADTYYTKEDDGLSKDWTGTVWMNPPYSQPLVSKFCDKFIERKMIGAITQGCVILNNATETKFLQKMLVCCTAICLIKGRVKFLDAEGNIVNSSPLQGQIILYFGPHRDKFAKVFNKFGVVFDAR